MNDSPRYPALYYAEQRRLERAQECIDRIDVALRGDARSAMLVVAAQEIINDYREGQDEVS